MKMKKRRESRMRGFSVRRKRLFIPGRATNHLAKSRKLLLFISFHSESSDKPVRHFVLLSDCQGCFTRDSACLPTNNDQQPPLSEIYTFIQTEQVSLLT